MTTPLSVLLLSDGRPGHFNLAEGILAAAGRMRPLAVHRIMARRGRWPGAVLATWSNSGKAAGPLLKIVYGLQPPDLPEAQLVVSAGAETLAANIACARLLGAANIFYGSLRRFRPESFDLVLTSYAGQCHRPRHAFALKPSPAANAARASRRAPPAKPPHRLALLIGGPSGESSWQDADWDRLQALVAGAASLGVGWRITNSRRTPAAVSDRFTALARSLPGSIDCFADVRRPDAPALADLIAESDAAIVTDDSSSMVSDAVAAGLAVVGLAPEQHRPTANEQSYRDHLAGRELVPVAAARRAHPGIPARRVAAAHPPCRRSGRRAGATPRRAPAGPLRPHASGRIEILAPGLTCRSTETSSSACAQMLQGLISRISFGIEIGVGPKPMMTRSSSLQKQMSPIRALSRAVRSRPLRTGISKWMLSPQGSAVELIGSAAQIRAAVGVSANSMRILLPADFDHRDPATAGGSRAGGASLAPPLPQQVGGHPQKTK